MNGDIVLVAGASRSGKTRWVQKRLERWRGPLLVWDPKGEYLHGARCETVAELAAELKRSRRACFVPGRDLRQSFAWWCVAAWSLRHVAPAVLVVEELADVTPPGRAPGDWGRLLRQGRGLGLTIYAITQSPAESDKTTIRNASLIHCCRLGRAQDRAYMARELDVPQERVDGLRVSRDRGEWIERDEAGRVRWGRLMFRSGRSISSRWREPADRAQSA